MGDHTGITVPPGKRFRLDHIDTGAPPDMTKTAARARIATLTPQLNDLQERLYASGERALLIVLQAMDCGGKDGTIKQVFGAFNPQGTQVTGFRAPTEEELAHDFLWRIQKAVPSRGMVGVFNRSHYEDVLVVRVKKLVPRKVWAARYEQINDFEERLAASNVTIVKLFLHISADEQAERLAERRDRPDKQWKFNPGDLDDRALWPDFRRAYEDALSKCNSEHAPWHVVPADRKWYRDLVVTNILLATMKRMRLRYPEPVADIASYEIPKV